MKKTALFLLAILFTLSACVPEVIDPIDNPDDNNSEALWEYKIDQLEVLLTDIVLDDNDNSYFFAKANDKYLIYSLDKDGNLRWTEELTFGSYQNSAIMIANDKLILSNNYDVIAAYNLSNGAQIWTTTLSVNFIDMAYENGIIYVAQSTTFNNESNISALDANTGNVKWNYPMNKHIDAQISVYQSQICVVTDDQLPWPYEITLTILTDNGSSATLAWDISKPHIYMESEAKSRRASFDGLGNIYFEQDVTDTTYIHSYDAYSGAENWKTHLCNFGLPEPAILFANGNVIATYKSAESWAIVNSTAIINATTGVITKRNDDIILNDNQILLTGDNSIIVFNRLLSNLPTWQKYNSSGDLTSSNSAEYVGGMITNFKDCRITSEGNLIYLTNDKVICDDANLTPATAGTWACRKGTNANTNTIN